MIGPRSEAIESFIDAGGLFIKTKAAKLFRVKSNPQLDKGAFSFSEDSQYPYFTRTVFNNGILGYVDYLDSEHLIPGNSIAVGMMGMQFFYQDHDFYAGQFTKTIFPLFNGLTSKVALWFITWFNKNRGKLLNGAVRQFESIFNELEIDVPYLNGEVAINFIEERVRELEEERVRELEAYLKACGFEELTPTPPEISALHKMATNSIAYKECYILDIFNVQNTHNILKTDVVFNSGSTPYITAGVGNNSIASYISYDESMIEHGNAIMIGGKTMVITYQPFDFYSNDSHNLLLTLQRNNLSENIGLFFVTTLFKSLSHKYHWGDSISKAKIKNDTVMIPVDKDGNIDLLLMENLISGIKKTVISQVRDFINQEHWAYTTIIR